MKCIQIDFNDYSQIHIFTSKMESIDMNNSIADYDVTSIEECNLSTLISLAENNTSLSNLAQDVLKERVTNKMIEFITYADGFKPLNSVEEHEKYIRIENLDLASKLLKNCGNCISHIRIDHHNLQNEQMSAIFESMNLHCSGTLIRLHVTNGPGNCFDAIAKPFEKVKIVSLHGDFDKLENSQLSFTEMFPAMQRLSLGKVFVENMNWVDNAYLNLKHLNVPICKDNMAPKRFTETVAIRLFNSNPYIRSLELWKASPNILKCVANHLKDLKELVLHNHNNVKIDPNTVTDRHDLVANSDNINIHFDKLKVLQVEFCSHTSLESLRFDNLEELRINCLPRQTCHRWIENMKNYNKLKKLHVDACLKSDDIHQLAMAKLKLVEFNLRCNKDVEIRILIELIKSSMDLRKIRLILLDKESSKRIRKVFREDLSSDWIIIEEDFAILLERNS